MKRYPFIVLYGAPNLGKTIQSEMLAQALDANYIKYPVYDLEPTGPLLNDILRKDVPATPLELQQLTAENRRCFEGLLEVVLSYRPIIGEAYIGTGIAHGMYEGVPQITLEELNKNLRLPDLSILLDGEHRFTSGIEHGHRFEGKDAKWEEIRNIHRELALIYGWKTVDANPSKERVHAAILQVVERSGLFNNQIEQQQ